MTLQAHERLLLVSDQGPLITFRGQFIPKAYRLAAALFKLDALSPATGPVFFRLRSTKAALHWPLKET
jgi:hypothetical protein